MKFHPLDYTSELPQRFTYPFCYKPHAVCVAAAEQLKRHISGDAELRNVAEQGKMFGVLVVRDEEERLGFLAAYSGTTCYDFDNTYFVPPVFDYLQEDGFFKTGERQISEINREIEQLESGEELATLLKTSADVRLRAEAEIECFRKKMEEARLLRNRRRGEGCTAEEEERMKDESRFMKAELKRLKARKEIEISEKTQACNEYKNKINELRRLRKQKSDALQDELFRHFEMLDKDGNKKDVCEIFKENGAGIPPAGTGECCAPKMIQYAFTKGFRLVSMAEFWYGKSPVGEIRHHLNYYPSCMGKCKPLLTYMLRGIDMDENPMEHAVDDRLEILYEDDYLCIINKPSGMPTVEGRIHTRSAEEILREMRTDCDIKAVHRLDMDTSGLVVFAKNEKTYVSMQKLFAGRQVRKRYTAVLDREIEQENGRIALPLSPDYLNRPMQMVDYENGKPAVTSYRVISRGDGHTRISLTPVTGRTHQLRVHCAHREGLDAPITGDNLYGTPSERLMLHASYIEFTHPDTNKKISLKSSPDF